MRGRTLGMVWVLAGMVFLLLVYWGVSTWRSLLARGQAVAVQRTQLVTEIKSRQEEMVTEMRSTNILQEMQFSVERADPSVFLTGLADLTQGTRIRVLAISPLERRTTPQFVKSWQTVQLTTPFQDLRELATRVEREKGILEDLVIEVPPPSGGTPSVVPGASPEIQARFKLTSMEVTGEAKRILQRAIAVTRSAPGPAPVPEPSLSLPFPPRPATGATAARDPFLFAAPALPPVPKPPVRVATGARPATSAPGPGRPFQITTSPVPGAAPTDPTAPPRPLARMEVKGIVGMPDGYLAIVNNEIVKAGDTIENHRVERITATDVVLRQPDGTLRSLTLPSVVSPPGARR